MQGFIIRFGPAAACEGPAFCKFSCERYAKTHCREKIGLHFPAILTGKACIFVPDCKPCVQERGGENRREN